MPVFSTNAKRPFIQNMCNFKLNFLSRGQLESLNLDRIFLPLFKILPCYEGFLVTLFLPLLLKYCAEIIFKISKLNSRLK